MAGIENILSEKIELLESTPEKYLSRVEKAQLELLKQANSLISEFNVDKGRLVLDLENLNLIEKINEVLKDTLTKGEYFNAVKDLLKSFDKSIELSNDYFSREIDGFKATDLIKNIYSIQRTKMLDLFIGNSSIDVNFLQPVRNTLIDAVTQEMPLKQLIVSIQDIAIGTNEYDGKLMRYSKQIAADALNISDRVYNTTLAKEFSIEFYQYLGGKLDTTRCFCLQRNNKYFHYKEIASWGEGDVDDGFEDDNNYKSCGKDWQGKYRDTNSTNIFNVLGGYNCRHSLAPRSLSSVPRQVLMRAIKKNYFKPSEKQKKLLNL